MSEGIRPQKSIKQKNKTKQNATIQNKTKKKLSKYAETDSQYSYTVRYWSYTLARAFVVKIKIGRVYTNRYK